MNLMKIYNTSPIFFQNIFTTIAGYRNKINRYGKEYYNYLDINRRFNDEDIDSIQQYQDREVKKLVNHAFKQSPFYKEFYKYIDIREINSVEDLKKLPILSKEVVRENINSLYTIKKRDSIITHTSGTTGKSMLFLHTKEHFQQRMAILDYFKEQHGFINRKMKKATFNSSRIIPSRQKKKVFWRDNIFMKQRIYSGYHCRGDNIRYYVENLNEYKPAALDGYPSSLFEIAKYIINHKIPLKFQPIAIFPSAETLIPHYRQTIEQAFNCKIFNQYSASEGAPFITECEYGTLHYNQYSGVIEVNGENEILVTGFSTYGTPLIRYEIGDKVIFDNSNKKCPCGSIYPIVHQIEGRSMDYLQSKSNGKFTAPYLLESNEFENSLISVQFVQNSINQVDVNIVADSSYNHKMDKIILEELNYILGSDMKVIIHKMKELPKEPSGKLRLIINNIHNNK